MKNSHQEWQSGRFSFRKSFGSQQSANSVKENLLLFAESRKPIAIYFLN